MLCLGIETATPYGSIALCRDDQVLCELSLRLLKGGGEYLLAWLERMMSQTGCHLSELDLIAVGTGPGSYTGIRVGLAAAKGLGAGLNIPVYGVSTLETIAHNALGTALWIATALDARRGELYAALYQATASGLVVVIPPQPMAAVDFVNSLRQLPEVILCGEGGKVNPKLWENYPQIKIASALWDRPLASQLAWIAGQKTDDLREDLIPKYLRRVEAEVKLEEQQQGRV